MPNDVSDWYGTPVSSSTPAGWNLKKLAEGGWKVAQRVTKKYLADKAYAERIKRIKQGQDIESQRLADASLKKNMRKTNIANTLVGKSAMRTTGKAKVKKNKTVKVPARLRKQIKQVLTGQTAQGSYVVIRQGFIGSIIASSAGSLDGDDLGTTIPSIFYNAINGLPGRTWFNALVNYNPATASTLISLSGLNYFTPAKILDAASVLFNRKAAGNPYVSTNNLSVGITLSSGAPAAGTGKLKINVINSFAQFTMKNVSLRTVTVEIWECTPTQKFQTSNPLASMAELYSTLSTNVVDYNFQYQHNGGNQLYAFFDPTLDPPEIAKKYFGYKFAWRKRQHIMAPGETCVHSVQGPKGILDYSKVFATGADAGLDDVEVASQINALFKGFSVGVMISVNGDFVLPLSDSKGGRFQYSLTSGALGMPISVEVKESYKIAVPEIAGFITEAGAAGTRQQLNLRKHKMIVWNQATAANAGYNVSNEENPTAYSGNNLQFQ